MPCEVHVKTAERFDTLREHEDMGEIIDVRRGGWGEHHESPAI